jgi:hypothetical protein
MGEEVNYDDIQNRWDEHCAREKAIEERMPMMIAEMQMWVRHSDATMQMRDKSDMACVQLLRDRFSDGKLIAVACGPLREEKK